MQKDRNWTVLLIGGPSGSGKSSVAYALAQHFGISVLEIDDIEQAVKAMTAKEDLPALHYYERTGINWMDVDVAGNVDWLIRVSQELTPALRAVIENHVDADVPVIIEGDFLHPDFAASFGPPAVRSFFVHEADPKQITRNYLAREGGKAQSFRAEISTAYDGWISGRCQALGIPLLASRPWETVIDRALALLQ